MTTAAQAAPSGGRPLADRLDRGRGANDWTMAIYDAVWEAARDGRHSPRCAEWSKRPHDGCMDHEELLAECMRRFNKSGTYRWYRIYITTNGLLDSNIAPEDVPWREVAEVKLKLQRRNIVGKGKHVRNVGGLRRGALWTVGDTPPRKWQPKVYRPGHFKPHVPAVADTETHRAVRRMPTGWAADVRAELLRPRPRQGMLVELLEEGVDLFGAPS